MGSVAKCSTSTSMQDSFYTYITYMHALHYSYGRMQCINIRYDEMHQHLYPHPHPNFNLNPTLSPTLKLILILTLTLTAIKDESNASTSLISLANNIITIFHFTDSAVVSVCLSFSPFVFACLPDFLSMLWAEYTGIICSEGWYVFALSMPMSLSSYLYFSVSALLSCLCLRSTLIGSISSGWSCSVQHAF